MCQMQLVVLPLLLQTLLSVSVQNPARPPATQPQGCLGAAPAQLERVAQGRSQLPRGARHQGRCAAAAASRRRSAARRPLLRRQRRQLSSAGHRKPQVAKRSKGDACQCACCALCCRSVVLLTAARLSMQVQQLVGCRVAPSGALRGFQYVEGTMAMRNGEDRCMQLKIFCAEVRPAKGAGP